MTINPREITDIDPEDGDSVVDAIRQLAEAIQDLQHKVLFLESEVDSATADIRDLEDKTAT